MGHPNHGGHTYAGRAEWPHGFEPLCDDERGPQLVRLRNPAPPLLGDEDVKRGEWAIAFIGWRVRTRSRTFEALHLSDADEFLRILSDPIDVTEYHCLAVTDKPTPGSNGACLICSTRKSSCRWLRIGSRKMHSHWLCFDCLPQLRRGVERVFERDDVLSDVL